jgi:dihydrofolate reductase
MDSRASEVGAAQGGYADNLYQVPMFILSHHLPEKVAKGAEEFMFVTNGLESAVEQAKAASGDRYVVVGGARISLNSI